MERKLSILLSYKSLKKFKDKLGGEIKTPEGFHGRQFREHPDNASEELKERRNRNSLDNTFSFWAKEQSLVDALLAAGFNFIWKQTSPNPFGSAALDHRVLYVCRK